jgi:hypothetical protein
MNKEEINETICNLQSEEEIIDFVNKRIGELEESSRETTVGQNYTTTFREYISQKTHYKPGNRFEDGECPDLVYDDLTPYIDLLKSIKKRNWYNELTLFTTIFYDVYNYLPSDDIGLERAFTYMSKKDGRLSIKEIKDNSCAFCSEKAGMAHNLFKFLDIDSELVCGYRNDEMHAYNLVYPNGYGNEPMIIYDPSFFVHFDKEGSRINLGYFKALKRDDYEKILRGEAIPIDISKTEKMYRDYLNISDEYTFTGDSPTYTAGFQKEMYKEPTK